MKRLFFFLCSLLVLMMACGSQKAVKVDPPESDAVAIAPPSPDAPPPPDAPPELRSHEGQEADKQEIREFIKNLNDSIRRKDFNAWKNALSPEYFSEISSAEFLAEKSNQKAMKMQKIVLKTPQDYFNKVVVPSRSSTRVEVDNIELEYITETRVKVFPVSAEGVVQQDRRLYELDHLENRWVIVN